MFERGVWRLGAVAGLALLAGCADGIQMPQFDGDLRGFGRGFSTADAARNATQRPRSDERGIISYPDYQVAEAREGDTLTTLAARVGLPEAELARYNGLKTGAPLRAGELVALPRRVQAENVDVTALAGAALDRVGDDPAVVNPAPVEAATPKRHQVTSGETAYSIARLHGVSVRSLAEWNALDSALTVRVGQYLLIPTGTASAPAPNTDTQPGFGTPTPLPPSSTAALPAAPRAEAEVKADGPASPNLGEVRTQASGAAMTMPAQGRIIGAYVKGRSDGIDIGAPAGSPVKAAASGTVAAITKDTDQVPILVLRHTGNLLTVYAGIDKIQVAKGASVGRGQTIAQVRAGDNAALHFQVRKGTSSVDPMDYLN